MAQPKFYLQPLAAAICVACYSTVCVASVETSTERISAKEAISAKTIHSLAPIVATAHQGNDANGLIVRADPKQPIQPIPATDGADYLQSIVGFSSVNSSAGTNGDVTFRGMFGSRIKILTDGTENLGACPSRMDSPTSYISPESYDRISVIKGPQTVQYANTGSAATVIFERLPENLSDNQHYRGQASVLMGSFGRLDQNVEVAVGDEQKYIRLNTNRSISNSYQDGQGTTVSSAWERWNADLALGWTPDDDTWMELTAGQSDGEAMYAGRKMDGSQFARESLGLRFEKKNVTDVIKKIESQVNYSFNDHIMDNFSLRDVPMIYPNQNASDHILHGNHSPMQSELVPNPSSMQVTRRTLNARMAMTQVWDKMQLITGIDTQNNKHAEGMVSRNMNMPTTEDMRFNSYGAFGELSSALSENNTLVSGVRLDQVKVEDLRANSINKGFNREMEKTLASGFIRFENQHPEHEDGKTYIGLGFVERMPDYWEFFSPKHGNLGSTNTFNGVDTEKTLQLDFGYQHQHGAFSSWASGYAGLVKDFILMAYHAHSSSSMSGGSHGHSDRSEKTAGTKNVDATIAGAEAGLGYQFTDAIQADISAMYAWGRNTTDDIPLPQISPLEARVNLRYIQDSYTLGAYWRLVDGQNRIAEDQGNIVGYDLKPSSGFGTLSLNGTYHVRDGLDVSVGIDNILDKIYTEHLNKLGASGTGLATDQQFNNIGRNYWARISMKF